MTFSYSRTVRFQDTDAAGVVYFANILAICHEAYEASLAAADIDLKLFFRHPDFAIPITHASGDFFRPMFCGDRLLIKLTPQLLTPEKFAIAYEISIAETLAAKATTKHVCIHPGDRAKIALPDPILQWIKNLTSES
jgi:1,4-dihydroxy-2-naphthoyl-CoA hydrolase